MLIACATAVEFDVASRGFLSEVAKLGKVLPSHGDQTEFFNNSERVDILPLNILPLSLIGEEVHPKESRLVAENEVVFILFDWARHIDVFLVDGIELDSLFGVRIPNHEPPDTVSQHNEYLSIVFLLFNIEI